MSKPFRLLAPVNQANNNNFEMLKARFIIEELKKQITDTDYKVIKCYEYSLCGFKLPYDIEALHAERQALRDRINELQGGE